MWMNRQDLLYTIRSTRRTPVLSGMAIIALAIGIGVNAGVFMLLNAMFLDAPTQEDPASFVQLYPRYEGWFTGSGQVFSFTLRDYDALLKRSHAVENAAAWQESSATLDPGNRRVSTRLVTCDYFHVFGIDRPKIGRFMEPGECNRGTTAMVVVLSEPFWKAQYGGDPNIIGKLIHLNGLALDVIGIIPSEKLSFLSGEVFVPYTLQRLMEPKNDQFANSYNPWLAVAGRLRKGYSKADAQAELQTILRQQDSEYVHNASAPDRKTSLVLTNGSFIEDPAIHNLAVAIMVIILGPLLLVLLLACSNATMLFLSRAIVRRGEIAVRLSLGAGRARLARMLLMESCLTALAAGLISIALAYRVPLMFMNIVDPSHSSLVTSIHPNWRVFGYLVVLILVATAVSSLAPMRAALKLDLVTALKGREGAATARSRTASVLIIAQIAMSFVVLASAILFGRLPSIVTGMDPGFDTRHTLAVQLDRNTSPENRAANLAFQRNLEVRILGTPGVQSLAYSTLQPFQHSQPSEIRIADRPKGQGKPASIDSVSKDFFSTFGIPLMKGRLFLAADAPSDSTASVAVVSNAFAQQFWSGADPVGNIIATPDDRRLTVIGVVADTRSERFGVVDGPRLYTLRNAAALDGDMYVRFTGSAKIAENAVRDAVKSLDPAEIDPPKTVWESLEASAENMRSLARIILVMASIAVLMAITGVYGVLSFAVSRRTREFGIKMVLGANRSAIFRSIIKRGLRQIAIGMICGVGIAAPAAWTLARLLKDSPLPLKVFDAPVIGFAAVLVVVVSLVAMFVPALRATQVDPMKALRTE